MGWIKKSLAVPWEGTHRNPPVTSTKVDGLELLLSDEESVNDVLGLLSGGE